MSASETAGSQARSVAPTPAPGSIGAWVLAARPATLAVSLAPVAVGAAIAIAVPGGLVNALAIAAAAWGAIWIQIGANFANDVFDFEKGADDESRLGPPRAAQLGLLSPRAMRWGMAVSFALAFVAGLYLTAVGGWVVVAIGIASILSAIAYTGGPYPLGYNGLGDVFVFLFFGLVAVAGTVWVGCGQLPAVTWLAASAVGALATCVLVVNNVRDFPTDRECGKRTVVVRFGRRFGIVEYAVLVVGAHLMPVAMLLSGMTGWPVLLGVITLPLGIGLLRRVARTKGAALNPYLGATARLMLLQALMMSLGLVLAA
jgi:1,4-dihydroxy-2-naphthoate polyprenyltransferase